MFRHGLFDLRVSKAPEGLFNTESYIPVKEIRSDRRFFSFSPVNVEADPYLFVLGDMLYLFYEEQKIKRKGYIRMVKTRDLIHWSEPVTVLRENFHLSYPFVFEDRGRVFMMPETGESGTIRIYRPCNVGLTQWTLYRELLLGEHFVDSSHLVHDGVYYLFTTVRVDGRYELLLYTSDSLEGEWSEHPCSPVCTGQKSARCGGVAFSYEGALYRTAQKCDCSYGEALAIYRIGELTRDSYCEELVYGNILPFGDPFYLQGGHHFNPAVFRGEWLVATDARGASMNLFDLIGRALDRIWRIFNRELQHDKNSVTMELQQFVEKFAEQFDETETSAFQPDTDFRSLEEWSSLTALSIIAMVDEEYDIRLKSDDIRDARTVKELYRIIESKK